MDKLFLEIEIVSERDETVIYTSVESFIALYVYRYLGSPLKIKLYFVRTNLTAEKLQLRSKTLRRELTEERIICKNAASLEAIRDLRLPIYAKDENTYIAGMCAVCRELVARQPCLEHRKILGFKNSCLLAPAESSIWTRFCEVNIVAAINDLCRKHRLGEVVEEVPVEVSRFERHMNEPVRMHNIYKLAREQVQLGQQEQCEQELHAKSENRSNNPKSPKVTIDCSIPKEQLPIEHRFAEGVIFTIADLVLYPCFRLIFDCYPEMLQLFPLTNTWLNEIHPYCSIKFDALHIPMKIPNNPNQTKLLRILDCEETSLYKSDPKRYKPRNRIYTIQNDVSAALAKLTELQLNFNSDTTPPFVNKAIDWSTIEPAHELNSALPQERLQRKRQQLENLANAVISLAKPGDRIVDFCSGTGHLGILLALQLPACIIIISENKAFSLERAKQRAAELNLTNCRFYQCNIDYFEGEFQVGTSLHACGTATDIVLQQCKRSHANFVCCPCCYGSLQPMPHIVYPLSAKLRAVLSEREFLNIAHAADQSHELSTPNCKPELTRQGQLCMDIVDTDRKLKAEEEGYEVTLTRLKPEVCTPKNRLLIGRFNKLGAPAANIES